VKGRLAAIYSFNAVSTECGGSALEEATELLQVLGKFSLRYQKSVVFLSWALSEW
jgi:hypothetical protein